MSWSSFEPGYGASVLTPWVKRLLIANAAIFLFMWISGSAGFFVEWFAFRPSRILTRPWGALTYMFLHAGFWHVFINMLMLFFFGRPLERRWGSREFIKYYLLCGLGGVALSFVFQSASIIGASAAGGWREGEVGEGRQHRVAGEPAHAGADAGGAAGRELEPADAPS